MLKIVIRGRDIVLKFLSNLGKAIALYFGMFLVALVVISFSSSFNPKYHERCNINISDYDFSFVSKHKEIKNYEIYLSCNTIDILIDTDLSSKEECSALMINLSYEMPKYKDLQITMKSINNIFYFKIIENGVVLLV